MGRLAVCPSVSLSLSVCRAAKGAPPVQQVQQVQLVQLVQLVRVGGGGWCRAVSGQRWSAPGQCRDNIVLGRRGTSLGSGVWFNWFLPQCTLRTVRLSRQLNQLVVPRRADPGPAHCRPARPTATIPALAKHRKKMMLNSKP